MVQTPDLIEFHAAHYKALWPLVGWLAPVVVNAT